MRRRVIVLAIVVVAVLLLLGRVLSAVAVDYQWYAQMHATTLWQSRWINGLLLTGSISVVTTLFVFLNLYAVRRSIASIVLPRRLGNVEIGEEVPGRYLTGVTIAVSVILGILFAMPPDAWIQLAAARYGIPFNQTDPYFDLDLGFYVYWLPLENALYVRTALVLAITFVVVAVLYVAVNPGLRWDRTKFRLTAHVRRHGAAFTPLFFALVAWNYRLEAYGVLSHGAGPGGLFTYADHHFVVPAERIVAMLLLAAGVVTALALWRAQMKTALTVVSLSLLMLGAYHFSLPLVEHGSIGTVALGREAGYSIVRRQATRSAYGLNRMQITPPASAPIRFASLREAAPRVSVWDPRALTEALPPTRQQATLSDGVGWRWSGSGLVAWGVEYGGEPITDAGMSTPPVHVLLPVLATAVDDHGGPERTDLAGRRGADESPIPPVLVYSGAVSPLIVADSGDRIAAPRIEGIGARLAAAWSAQRLNWLGVQLPEPHPKLVDRRDVGERVRAIAPFFTQGTIISPILVADSLYWVVDLYTAADTYPLSEHFTLAGESQSYFQHAATAFVHAYTGRVLMVADSVHDVLTDTWLRAFPELFTSWRNLPVGLAAATPPAFDGQVAVAAAFAAVGTRLSERAGVAPPQQPAFGDDADSLLASGEPPCIAMNGSEASCATVVPLMDLTDHVTGLVVAAGGPQRDIMWVPLDATAPSWSSAMARLRQAGDSALVGRRDATIVRGRVRALLVDNRLALVQPQYSWRSAAPKTLVVVAATVGDTVVTGPTLVEAVGADTLTPIANAPGIGPGVSGSFRARVAALYDSMQNALKRGDMAAFGAAYNELGRLLGRPSPSRASESPGAASRN